MKITAETHSNIDFLYLDPVEDGEAECLRNFARAYEPIEAYIETNQLYRYPRLVIRKKKK